jgi:hypothetical protein
MSQYWIVGANLDGENAQLVIAEASPEEAARAAVEKFGFLRLDLIELVGSELRNDLQKRKEYAWSSELRSGGGVKDCGEVPEPVRLRTTKSLAKDNAGTKCLYST